MREAGVIGFLVISVLLIFTPCYGEEDHLISPVVSVGPGVLLGASISPSGDRFLTGSRGGLQIWDMDGKLLYEMYLGTSSSGTWSLDGSKIAASLGNGTYRILSKDGVVLYSTDSISELYVKLADWEFKNVTYFSEEDRANLPDNMWGRAQSNNNSLIATWFGGDHDIHIFETKTWSLVEKIQTAGQPMGASWSPDDSKLAYYFLSAGWGRALYLWDAHTKDTVAEATVRISSRPTWSPDGTMIAMASVYWVKIFNGTNLDPLGAVGPADLLINGISWSLDGTEIITTSFGGGQISYWNLSMIEEERVLSEESSITQIDVSSTGLIGYGLKTGKVVCLSGSDLGTQEFSATIPQGASITCLDWSDDSTAIAAGSETGSIAIWTERGDPDRTWRGHDGRVFDLEFHPDGQVVATVGADGYLVFCDRGQSGLVKKLVESKTSKKPRSLAWSPNGSMIAVGFEEGSVRIWSYPEFEVQVAPQRPGKFTSLEWVHSIEGVDMLCGGGFPDGSALVWGAWGRSGLYEKLREHRDEITDIAINSDESLLATCSRDGVVAVWQTRRYEIFGERMIGGLVEVFYIGEELTSISWSSDESLLTSSETGNLYRLFIPEKLLWSKNTHTTQIRGVSWAPDSQKVCYNTNTKDMAIYDLETGNIEKHNLDLDQSTRIISFDWSPDGTRIAVRDSTGTITIITPTVNELLTIPGDEQWYYDQWSLDIEFSPDSAKLASASADRSIRIINSQNGELITVLTGHTKLVTDVSWSDDNKWLASCSSDGYVKIWDMTKGELYKSIYLSNVMAEGVDWSIWNRIAVSYLNTQTGKRILNIVNPEGRILWEKVYEQGFLGYISWSPGGDHLAVPNYMTRRDRTTIYTKSGYPLGNLTSGIWEKVEWSPDEQYLASGGYDGVLRLYEMDPITSIIEAGQLAPLILFFILIIKRVRLIEGFHWATN